MVDQAGRRASRLPIALQIVCVFDSVTLVIAQVQPEPILAYPSEVRAQAVAQPPSQSAANVDCYGGGWTATWTDEKKDMCCALAGVGCPDLSMMSGGPQVLQESSEAHWGEILQPVELPQTPLQQVSDAVVPVQTAPALPTAQVVAQPPAEPAATMPVLGGDTMAEDSMAEEYDCNAGRAGWQKWWGGDKRRWCCIHASIGCPTTTTTTSVTSTRTSTTLTTTSITTTSITTTSITTTSITITSTTITSTTITSTTMTSTRTSTTFTSTTVTSTTSTSKTQTTTVSTTTGTQTSSTISLTETPTSTSTWTTTSSMTHSSSTITTTNTSTTSSTSRTRTLTASTTSKINRSFDCTELYVWSTEKQEWCCKHKQIGCPQEEQDTDANGTMTVKPPEEFWKDLAHDPEETKTESTTGTRTRTRTLTRTTTPAPAISPAIATRAKACGTVVHVTGAEQVQGPRMGDYTQESFLHDGRPVYKNKFGQFLYYWGAFKGWRIGDSYTSPFAGVKSKAGEGVECPDEATGWTVFAGSGWLAAYHITITKPIDLQAPVTEFRQAVELRGDRPSKSLRRQAAHPAAQRLTVLGLPAVTTAPAVAFATLAAFAALVVCVRKGAIRQHHRTYNAVGDGLGLPLRE